MYGNGSNSQREKKGCIDSREIDCVALCVLERERGRVGGRYIGGGVCASLTAILDSPEPPEPDQYSFVSGVGSLTYYYFPMAVAASSSPDDILQWCLACFSTPLS